MDETMLEHPPVVSSVRIYDDNRSAHLCRLIVNFPRPVVAVRIDEKLSKALGKLSAAREAYESDWDLLLEKAKEDGEEEAIPSSTVGKFLKTVHPDAFAVVAASPLAKAFNEELSVIALGMGDQLPSYRWGGGVIHQTRWIVDYDGEAVVEDASVVGDYPHYERRSKITVRAVLNVEGKAMAIIIDDDVGVGYSYPEESKKVSVRVDLDNTLERRVNKECRCFNCSEMRADEAKKAGGAGAKRVRVAESSDEDDEEY